MCAKWGGIDNNESMNRRGALESLYSTGLQHPSYATDSNVLPFFSFIYILWHRGWITDWNVVCVALKTPFAPSAFPKQSQQIHLSFLEVHPQSELVIHHTVIIKIIPAFTQHHFMKITAPYLMLIITNMSLCLGNTFLLLKFCHRYKHWRQYWLIVQCTVWKKIFKKKMNIKPFTALDFETARDIRRPFYTVVCSLN